MPIYPHHTLVPLWVFLLVSYVISKALGNELVTSAMYQLAAEDQTLSDVEPLSNAVGSSVIMCGATCLQQAGCVAYTWAPGTNTCVTYPGGGIVVSSLGQQLYRKDQSCSGNEMMTTPCIDPSYNYPIDIAAGLKLYTTNILLFGANDKLYACSYGAVVGEETPDMCTFMGFTSVWLAPTSPSNIDTALPLIRATEIESRYLLFSGSNVYCYSIHYQEVVPGIADPTLTTITRVNCIDENQPADQDTLITDLFGVGIPSDLDAAVAANWDDTNTHRVWFLKNNELWKATHNTPSQTPVKYSNIAEVQALLGGNHCDVTAVITGLNPGEYIFIRGSYVFTNYGTTGQRNRFCAMLA